MAYPYQFNPFGGYGGYQQPQPAQQSAVNWVSGRPEADAYPMAPNTVLPLWDRNQQIIYWKQCDAAGRQSIRELEYTDRTQAQPAQPAPEPVTKADLEAVLVEVRGLAELIKGGAIDG